MALVAVAILITGGLVTIALWRDYRRAAIIVLVVTIVAVLAVGAAIIDLILHPIGFLG
jgi:hypothetical protein